MAAHSPRREPGQRCPALDSAHCPRPRMVRRGGATPERLPMTMLHILYALTVALCCIGIIRSERFLMRLYYYAVMLAASVAVNYIWRS